MDSSGSAKIRPDFFQPLLVEQSDMGWPVFEDYVLEGNRSSSEIRAIGGIRRWVIPLENPTLVEQVRALSFSSEDEMLRWTREHGLAGIFNRSVGLELHSARISEIRRAASELDQSMAALTRVWRRGWKHWEVVDFAEVLAASMQDHVVVRLGVRVDRTTTTQFLPQMVGSGPIGAAYQQVIAIAQALSEATPKPHTSWRTVRGCERPGCRKVFMPYTKRQRFHSDNCRKRAHEEAGAVMPK